MANPEHVEWLREGVASWNARRRQSDFVPDLDGANLPAILQGDSYSRSSIYLGTSLEGIDFKHAIIRNASLSGINFAKADFTFAQLAGSYLTNTDLSEATLAFADFSDAMLLSAQLTGARADNANFSGANLSGASLDSAVLSRANFSGVSLVKASIKKTDLRRTFLVGADLTATEPWRSILYDHSEARPSNLSTLSDYVRGVGESIGVVRNLVQGYSPPDSGNNAEAPVLYFRGEALNAWELRPSATRVPSEGQPDIRGKEGEMLLDLMTRRPEEFSQMQSALSQWVLAQHHGLKTRLLDITRNPLVALFWACDDSPSQQQFGDRDGVLHIFAVPRSIIKPFNSDSISVVTNFAKLLSFEQTVLLGKNDDEVRRAMLQSGQQLPAGFLPDYREALVRLYHYIGREKLQFRERLDPRDLYRVFVVEPEQSFERVRAQSGSFLVSAFHERFEPHFIRKHNPETPVYAHHKFRIPSGRKQDVLGELEILGITRESLIPGLEETAQAVMRRHGR